MSRLWDKGAPLDSRVLAYTAGEDFALDDRLVPYDVRASIAHAEMLHAQKLLDKKDCDAIREGLNALAAAHAHGEWHVELADEDGQTALERRLTERIGAAGGRVHLGRSRNDQVLTALRLYLRDATAEISAAAIGVASALDGIASRQGGIALPGYTHMQQAMPSSVALWAGGFASEIRDDAQGIQQTQRRLGKNPLGSAAGYGTPGLPLDPEATRHALGFASIHEPATAVQLSRGKAESQLLFEIALMMQDFGRLAADLLLFYTQEFAFISLPDAFTTGSSIMPQKRNPDVLELIRGKSARVIADVQQILTLLKGLPLAYNRDLQEDKLAFFDALDTVQACLALAPSIARHAKLQVETINARLEEGFLDATTLMEYLIGKGVPMRTGHEVVGRLVRMCESRPCKLVDLPLAELQHACDKIEADVSGFLGVRNVVARLSSFGSGGHAAVAEQVAAWRERLTH